MGFLDELISSAKVVVDKAGKQTDKVVEVSKLKYQSIQLQNELSHLYEQLGVAVYSKMVEEYDNGDLTLNRGWRYVDLTPLGEVNELYFTMKSTDAGAYGDNTPDYFCLDKLQVKRVASDPTAVNGIAADSRENIRYDRASKMVTVQGADFAAVYDAAGSMVMSSEQSSFSLEYLPAGVYVVKAGNARIKIAR